MAVRVTQPSLLWKTNNMFRSVTAKRHCVKRSKVILILLFLLFMLTIIGVIYPNLVIYPVEFPTVDEYECRNCAGLEILQPSCPRYAPDTVHVCVSSDSKMLHGLMATINSIRSNTRRPVVYHIVTYEDTVEQIRTWVHNSVLRNITYDYRTVPRDLMVGLFADRGGRKSIASAVNFARYYYPTLFPCVKTRLIHIDSDIIVQDDIGELFDVKFDEGTGVAFSIDNNKYSSAWQYMFRYVNPLNVRVWRMKLDMLEDGFNAGFYVADVTWWKQNHISKVVEYWTVLNVKENLYGAGLIGTGTYTQAPMILALHDRYTVMDHLWNVRRLGVWLQSLDDDVIRNQAKGIHWNGRLKPWDEDTPYRDIWLKYYVPKPCENPPSLIQTEGGVRSQEQQSTRHVMRSKDPSVIGALANGSVGDSALAT